MDFERRLHLSVSFSCSRSKLLACVSCDTTVEILYLNELQVLSLLLFSADTATP